MANPDKTQLKNLILNHLYARISKQGMDKGASASTIRRALKVDTSTNYLEVLIESLADLGFIRDEERFNRYALTESGIDFIESGSKVQPGDAQIIDSWSMPDVGATLTVSSAEIVKLHLGQCLTLIAASNFTQEEKSQIAGLIRICEQIVDLPTPKLGLLRRILSWLKEVKELIPLVEAVLKIVGKA